MIFLIFNTVPTLDRPVAEPVLITGEVLRVSTEKLELSSPTPYEEKKPIQKVATPKPAKKVTPKPQPVATHTTSQVEVKIRAKFGRYANRAIAIARCESSLNPAAIGDLHIYPHSYGVFQIRALKGRPSPDWLLNIDNNIDYAYQMSGGGVNWGAWTCARKV